MKGFFLSIYATLAFLMNTCSFLNPPISEPPLSPCTWGPAELHFWDVELSVPSCVNLGLGIETFYDISEPFTRLVYSGSANYGEFRWTSTNLECTNQTKTQVTIFDTDNHNTSSLWNGGTPIDSALTITGSTLFSVFGTATITINGVFNYSTFERVSLIWESPVYDGSGMFRFLEWIETAQVANLSNMGRVYVHNEYQ